MLNLMLHGVSFHVLSPEKKNFPLRVPDFRWDINANLAPDSNLAPRYLLPGLNLLLRLSGQRLFIIFYVIMTLSYFI